MSSNHAYFSEKKNGGKQTTGPQCKLEMKEHIIHCYWAQLNTFLNNGQNQNFQHPQKESMKLCQSRLKRILFFQYVEGSMIEIWKSVFSLISCPMMFYMCRDSGHK